MERLVDTEGEKVPVSLEVEETPPEEDFAFKLLFVPSGNAPTQMSGTIVYTTTAVICELQPTSIKPPTLPFIPNSRTLFVTYSLDVQ